ncbi:TPA: carbamoyl-phosphate synthase [Bacillus luti]|nr:carbamoyl-phosphate synthase [Bacillus luti]
MADGRVEIETRLDSSNIRRDVEQTNRELSRVGSNMGSTAREMRNTFGNEFTQMNRDISRGYTQVSQAHMDMMNEMKNASRQQKAGMQGVREQQIEAQYGYFKLAQSSQTYAGTTREFMSEVQALGAAQKKANDAAINGNRMAMMGMLQTIGYMQNMTTQATRISENYTRMANPLYSINRAGLAAADGLNRLANAGNASVLSLKMLGPTASMKDLNNMTMMITQGLMRFQMVALAAAASSAILYGALHKSNMEMNPKYAEAYTNMLEKLSKAFQPMKDAFAAMMVPIYNFISAIADLIIKFNEAHPVLAKFIQGVMMLIPLLTLILSPLAIGIGLWNGMLAAWSSIWMLIGPLVTGLAAMSATVWVVAAAVVGLAMYLTHLWKTSESFRNAIMSAVGAVSAFGKSIVALGKYLFWTAVDGDHLNDWITHLPESFQPAAEKVGQAIAKMRTSIISCFQTITQFGQNLLNLGRFFLGVAADGDVMNDWFTHLPASWQPVADAIGGVIVSIRTSIMGLFSVITQFGQNLLNLGRFFLGVAIDGDVMNDWFTHLPASWQPVADAIGGVIATMSNAFVGLFGPLNQIGTAFLNLGNYILSVATTGDIMNQWISTLPGGFANAGLLIGQAVLIIKTAISGLVEAIRLAMGGDASQLGQIFATILPSLITMLIGGLPALLITAMRFLPTIVEGLNATSGMLSSTITTLLTGIVTIITTYLPQFLNQGIAILTKVMEGILQILPTVVTTLVECATTMINSFITIIGTLLPVILDAGIKILMAVIDGIIQNLPAIIDAALTVIDTLVQSLVTLLPQIIDAGIKILMALIDGIIKILPQLIQTAITLIMKIADTILQNLPKIIEAGIKILMALIDGIIKILPQLIEAGITIMTKLLDTWMKNLPKILQAGMKILSELIKGIIQILPQLIATGLKLIVEIARVIIANLPQILSAGVQILKMLIQGIVSMVGSLLSTITSNVIGGIKNCFSNAGTMLLDIGKNIIQGLINGISGMVGKAVSAVKSVASNIKDGIADFFDIHSPSRLMYSMGEFVTEGLANGIVSLSKYAVNETERMTNAIVGAFDELGEDIALGEFVAGSIPDIDDSISDSIKLAFPQVKGLLNNLLTPPEMNAVANSGNGGSPERDNSASRLLNNASPGENNSPTYLIMDKKVVGELLATDIKDINDRNAVRLAKFS